MVKPPEPRPVLDALLGVAGLLLGGLMLIELVLEIGDTGALLAEHEKELLASGYSQLEVAGMILEEKGTVMAYYFGFALVILYFFVAGYRLLRYGLQHVQIRVPKEVTKDIREGPPNYPREE